MTLADLKSDVADWLLRDDIDSVFSSWVKLCESNNRRYIRIPRMDAVKEDFTTASAYDLPAGFIEIRRIYNDTTAGVRNVILRSPDLLHKGSDSLDTDGQTYYAIENNQIVFEPAGQSTIKMLYTKAFDALVNDSDSNWLLENAYDVYLYGTLAHSAAWAGDDGRIMTWRQAYTDAVDRLVISEKKSVYTGGAITRMPGAAL